MDIQNKKLDEKTFYTIQQDVLRQYKTGADVNFDEAVAFHHDFALENNLAHVIQQAKNNKHILIQPRCGVADIDKHIELIQFLQKQGKADVLSATIDSYTRHNRYDEAESGLNQSKEQHRSLLNGFPAVNHGVKACRKVTTSISAPVQVRHGTPDARLLAEITLAGGFTSYEGGGISYNIPYSKNNDLEKTIFDWQYCDRLVGLYQQAGVTINREPYGPLTGTLVPPSISHVVAIVEALLAAEQGVKDITVGYGQGGHLFQDVAAIRTLETLTNTYLHRFGYHDVAVSTVLHQWMGGFPQDEAAAYGVISYGSMTAALAGANKMIVKSPHEALGIPTAEANASGLRTSRQIVDMLVDQKMSDNDQLQSEIDIITLETNAIMDKLLDLGDQDIARGIVIGFKAGVIDVPFAPSQLNKGLILPARDHYGAIRFLEMGNLPFNDDIKAFHYNKLLERANKENRSVDFQMVIDDIYAVGKGKMIGRKEGY